MLAMEASWEQGWTLSKRVRGETTSAEDNPAEAATWNGNEKEEMQTVKCKQLFEKAWLLRGEKYDNA